MAGTGSGHKSARSPRRAPAPGWFAIAWHRPSAEPRPRTAPARPVRRPGSWAPETATTRPPGWRRSDAGPSPPPPSQSTSITPSSERNRTRQDSRSTRSSVPTPHTRAPGRAAVSRRTLRRGLGGPENGFLRALAQQQKIRIGLGRIGAHHDGQGLGSRVSAGLPLVRRLVRRRLASESRQVSRGSSAGRSPHHHHGPDPLPQGMDHLPGPGVADPLGIAGPGGDPTIQCQASFNRDRDAGCDPGPEVGDQVPAACSATPTTT
jgi:hypothetical protein